MLHTVMTHFLERLHAAGNCDIVLTYFKSSTVKYCLAVNKVSGKFSGFDYSSFTFCLLSCTFTLLFPLSLSDFVL